MKKRARKRGRPAADFSARGQILMGAGAAFGKKGFDAASVEDICREANVVRSTFYRFYRSKEDVFAALLDTATTALVQSVRVAIASATTTEARMDAALDAYLRAQAFAGPLARVLVHAATTPNPIGMARRERSVRELASLFRDGLGDDAPDDLLVYKALLSALEAISLDLMAEGGIDEEKIARGKRLMKMLLAGLVPSSVTPRTRRR
jgi:AcrR family transcriptional regulator